MGDKKRSREKKEVREARCTLALVYSLSPSTTVCQSYFPLGVPLLKTSVPPRSQFGYAVFTLVLPPDLSSVTI